MADEKWTVRHAGSTMKNDNVEDGTQPSDAGAGAKALAARDSTKAHAAKNDVARLGGTLSAQGPVFAFLILLVSSGQIVVSISLVMASIFHEPSFTEASYGAEFDLVCGVLGLILAIF